MRPYRLVEETLDEDDEYPRVVPIGASGRGRAIGLVASSRRQPWTPLDGSVPSAPRRADRPPMSVKPGLTRTHRWMIAGFVIICVGMVLGLAMVRVWDEASRAVAGLPPEGGSTAVHQPAAAAGPNPPVQSAEATPPAAPGAVTTEIRVLEPNYTVAPGDTLGIIARKHGTSVDALASINNLENRNSLSVGQKLIIP